MSVGPLTQLARKISSALSKSDSQERQDHLDRCGNPIADTLVQEIKNCHPGQRVEVIGTVKIVAIRPGDMPPALEIELADPTGAINVIWLGRRKIPGIVAGRTMKVCGRLTGNTGKPTIFNPRYELRPTQQ